MMSREELVPLYLFDYNCMLGNTKIITLQHE